MLIKNNGYCPECHEFILRYVSDGEVQAYECTNPNHNQIYYRPYLANGVTTDYKEAVALSKNNLK